MFASARAVNDPTVSSSWELCCNAQNTVPEKRHLVHEGSVQDSEHAAPASLCAKARNSEPQSSADGALRFQFGASGAVELLKPLCRVL